MEKLIYSLLILVLLIAVFNTIQISQLKSVQFNTLPTGNIVRTVYSDLNLIPKGTPKIYGIELGVSYDDISSSNQQKADATIRKLGILDEQITLSGKDLQRYINIASQISCEYCCGVESIIFSNGKPACSCAHSFAMRGLAKYLIKYHGNEYSNDEILEELSKWKTLFFPSQITQKANALQAKGIELNYINLASNKYRDIEKSKATGNAVIDTSGWTEDEKMNYEHHGILPARLQQNSIQTSQVGSC